MILAHYAQIYAQICQHKSKINIYYTATLHKILQSLVLVYVQMCYLEVKINMTQVVVLYTVYYKNQFNCRLLHK